MLTISIILAVIFFHRMGGRLPGGTFILRSRSFAWLENYLERFFILFRKLSFEQSKVITLSLFLPLIMLILLGHLASEVLFGELGKAFFSGLVLLYCIGNTRNTEEYDSALIVAHEQNFAILFWFVLIGPVGAFSYWFLMMSKQAVVVSQQPGAEVQDSLAQAHAIAAWIPARITGFLYALVGNFAAGYECWQSCMRMTTMHSSQVLLACGQAALETGPEDRESHLVDRALVAWIVLSILILLVK